MLIASTVGASDYSQDIFCPQSAIQNSKFSKLILSQRIGIRLTESVFYDTVDLKIKLLRVSMGI